MNKLPQRPVNIPDGAIYNSQNNEWELHTDSSATYPTGKVMYWNAEGVLLEEALFQDDGDTRTYKAYTPDGNVWCEGGFQEGLRTWTTYYRCDQSNNAFRSHSVPDEAITLKLLKLNPDGRTLIYKAYNEQGEVVKEYADENNTYTPFEYGIVKVLSALKTKNYAAALKRHKDLEPLMAQEDDKKKQHYSYFAPVVQYLASNQPASRQLFDACVSIKYRTIYKIDEIVKQATTAYIEKLCNEGKTDEAIALIEETNKDGKLGYDTESMLYEWEILLRIATGKYSLSQDEYYPLRSLMVLRHKGECTSASDFIFELPEVKTYMQSFKNLPSYTYNKDKKEVVFHGDVVWQNTFRLNELPLYLPEITQLDKLVIEGSFTVKGSYSSLPDFSIGYLPDVHISGDFTATSVTHYNSSLIVGGNLKAQRYLYLKSIDTYQGATVQIKGMIDTPLFVIYGGLKMKHTAGFSDNCLHVATYSSSHKYIKVHHPDNLRPDICQNRGPYYEIDFDTLLQLFEAGEPIFKEGYNPATSTVAGWGKLETAKQLTANCKFDEALKVLGKIKKEDIQDQTLIAFERIYFEILIRVQQQNNQDAAKINKLCNAAMKLYQSGEVSPQARWEMLRLITDWLADEANEKGNIKKTLSLISTVNDGGADYYTRKAQLLWELGKKKEALFPAYIATHHYDDNACKEIITSKEFAKYADDCQSSIFVLPKGYKQKYDNAISKTPFAEWILTDEDEEDQGIVLYKNDVFWNGDLTAIEEIQQMPEKVFCNSLVVLGDLYVKGRLMLHQVDLYVAGNLFVDEYYQGDSRVFCAGNVFCKNDYRIKADIGGADTTILGNISAGVIAIHPNEFEVFGKVDPQTLCIGINNYDFVDAPVQKVYTSNDLLLTDEQLLEDNTNLTELLKNGKLLK